MLAASLIGYAVVVLLALGVGAGVGAHREARKWHRASDEEVNEWRAGTSLWRSNQGWADHWGQLRRQGITPEQWWDEEQRKASERAADDKR